MTRARNVDQLVAAGYVEIPQGELRAFAASYDPDPDDAPPLAWLQENTGEYAWSLQREIWAACDERDRIAVLSCNNSGKTWLAARIVVRWVKRYWRSGVRVVTTAPTAAQVSLLLWQEIRAAVAKVKALHGNGILPGHLVQSPFPQWKIGAQSVAFGRKPADDSAMQGVHEKHVLVVLDEAGGVPANMWAAAEKITTTGHCVILAIGNPDDINSPFGEVTRPGSGWHVIRVDGLRTPNMTREALADKPLTRALMEHEGIPYSTEKILPAMRENMLNPEFVERSIVRIAGVPADQHTRMGWSELGQFVADRTDVSALFTAMIRGRFPTDNQQSCIPLAWVLRAVERWKQWNTGTGFDEAPPRATPVGSRVIGVDVATANGADNTVIAPRDGNVSLEVVVYPLADTEDTIRHAWEHVDGIPGALAVIDVIGVGVGVRDGLARRSSVQTVAFVANARTDRGDRHGHYRFNSTRDAAWWRLRELLDPAYGSTICLPPDMDLITELTAPTWEVRIGRGHGIIHVEPKPEVKKRINRSPDRADAVVMSYWVDSTAQVLTDGSVDGGGGVGAIPWADRPKPETTAVQGIGAVAYKLGDDEQRDDDW